MSKTEARPRPKVAEARPTPSKGGLKAGLETKHGLEYYNTIPGPPKARGPASPKVPASLLASPMVPNFSVSGLPVESLCQFLTNQRNLFLQSQVVLASPVFLRHSPALSLIDTSVFSIRICLKFPY